MKFFPNHIAFVFLFIALACGHQEVTDEVKQNSNDDIADTLPMSFEDTVTQNLESTIPTQSNLPDEIEGCSCYFSETEELFNSRYYFFASDYDSLAFVLIDDEWIELELVSTEREPRTFGDYDHREIYSNDSYFVTIDMIYKSSSGDETWINTGTIEIETEGNKTVQEFIGECGC